MKELIYYLIRGKQLAKCEDNLYYLYKDNKWVLDTEHYVSDMIVGYDPSEPPGSPYKMFNTSIMDQIEVISEEEFKKLSKK